MKIEADLDVVIDGVPAHVRGDGASLVVEAVEPARLLRSVRRTSLASSRRDVAGLAEGLAARGATVRLDGPSGRVVTVGAAADAGALRILTGSRHLAPGSARGALALAATARGTRWLRPALVAAVVVATSVLLGRARRR